MGRSWCGRAPGLGRCWRSMGPVQPSCGISEIQAAGDWGHPHRRDRPGRGTARPPASPLVLQHRGECVDRWPGPHTRGGPQRRYGLYGHRHGAARQRGRLAQAQTPGAGRTLWYSGSTSNNAETVAVRQFGTVLLRDSWYESTTLSGFCVLGAVDATLTLDNVRVATPLFDTPAPVTCAGTRGRVALIGVALDDRIVLTGTGAALELLALGAVGNNLSETLPDYFQDTTSPAADARLLLSRQKVVGDYGSEQVANEGSVNNTFVTTMLALVRSSIPGLWTLLAPGVSDVRLHRVSIRDASIGLHAVATLPAAGQRPPRPVISAARRRRW